MEAYRVDERDDNMNNEARIVRVETVIENINYILERMDKRFDKLEVRMEKTDKKIEELRTELCIKIDNNRTNISNEIQSNIHRLETKIDTNFKWVVGMMITLFVLNGIMPAISKLISGMIAK